VFTRLLAADRSPALRLTLVLPTDRELLLTYISALAVYMGVTKKRA